MNLQLFSVNRRSIERPIRFWTCRRSLSHPAPLPLRGHCVSASTLARAYCDRRPILLPSLVPTRPPHKGAAHGPKALLPAGSYAPTLRAEGWTDRPEGRSATTKMGTDFWDFKIINKKYVVFLLLSWFRRCRVNWRNPEKNQGLDPVRVGRISPITKPLPSVRGAKPTGFGPIWVGQPTLFGGSAGPGSGGRRPCEHGGGKAEGLMHADTWACFIPKGNEGSMGAGGRRPQRMEIQR